jgi:hypothetical protein
MYAYTCESGPDFSVECALLVITHCFLVTPHHLPFVNGCMPVPCLATLTAANIYSPLQYLVLAISRKAGALGILRPHLGEAMQDSGFELLRIPLLRGWVNKVRKEPGHISRPSPIALIPL